MNPKFGHAKGEYFFDRDAGTISKGVGSVKGLGSDAADALYEIAQKKHYDHFCNLLTDIYAEHACDSGQLDTLIKVDYFSEFGNQRELLRIVDIFEVLKRGAAKQIKKETVDGTDLGAVIAAHSVGTAKSGAQLKSYTQLDCPAILRECEEKIKAAHMPEISLQIRTQNYFEKMGYLVATGDERDRDKLYVSKVFPAHRKSDNKIFGYNIKYQSIGSGKSGTMTVFAEKYRDDPIKEGDIVQCFRWDRNGKFFHMREYAHIY